MKILVDYDANTGNIILSDGSMYYVMTNLVVEEFKETSSEALELVKQGLTAQDLIKLKQQDII